MEVKLSVYAMSFGIYHTEVRYSSFDVSMSSFGGLTVQTASDRENDTASGLKLVKRVHLGYTDVEPAQFWQQLEQIRRNNSIYHPVTNNCRTISCLVIDVLNPPHATVAILELRSWNHRLLFWRMIATELIKLGNKFMLGPMVLTFVNFAMSHSTRNASLVSDWLKMAYESAREQIQEAIKPSSLVPFITIRETTSSMSNYDWMLSETGKTMTTYNVTASLDALTITAVVFALLSVILTIIGKY